MKLQFINPQKTKNKKHLLFSSQHFLQLFFVHLGSDIITLKVRLGTAYLVETENTVNKAKKPLK